MLQEVLAHYWLNEQEAAIYLQCLSLGEAPASTIARCIRKNRVTVYSTLQNIIKKWALESITKKNTTFYTCVSPQILAEQLQQRSQQFTDALSLFQAITKQWHHKVKTTFFQWLEGLKTLYQDLLSDNSTSLKAFLGSQSIDTDFRHYLEKTFLPQRIKRKIFAQVIVPSNPSNDAYAKTDKKNFRKTLISTNPIFNPKNEITLYGRNKVSICMFSSEELSGIRIESQDLYDSLESIFDTLRTTLGWKVPQKS